MYTMSLFDPGPAPGAPQGFRYLPAFLSQDEEDAILALAVGATFVPYVIRDQPSKRLMAFLGAYRRNGRAALPAILSGPRDRAAAEAGLSPGRYSKALLQEYPPGAGIGFHSDYDTPGDAVIGFNLRGPCTMRLRRIGDRKRIFAQELLPRSAYILGGEARHRWLHGIPPVKSERWSLTLRSSRS